MTNVKKADIEKLETEKTDIEVEDTTDVTIKFTYPIHIDGVKTKTIVMRRPKVNDCAIAAKNGKGDESKTEMYMFSRLTGIPLDVMRQMDLLDYRRMGQVFNEMTSIEGNPVDET